MEAFARHFGQPPEEVEHWGAVGYLHDYDYQRFPSEHLAHTEVELRAEGVEEADIRDVIRRSVELLGLELAEAIAICIDGMRPYAGKTGLLPRPASDSRNR